MAESEGARSSVGMSEPPIAGLSIESARESARESKAKDMEMEDLENIIQEESKHDDEAKFSPT